MSYQLPQDMMPDLVYRPTTNLEPALHRTAVKNAVRKMVGGTFLAQSAFAAHALAGANVRRENIALATGT